MVKTDTDFSKIFAEPKVGTWLIYATYIPAFMGDNPKKFVRTYAVREPFNRENEMHVDLINLEADPFVSDITIAKVYKEHKNVHR